MDRYSNSRECSFWARTLKLNLKSNKNGQTTSFEGEDAGQQEKLGELAERVVMEAREGKVFASVGTLAAQFLFQNGRPFGPEDWHCPITTIGYLNSINDGAGLSHFLAEIFPKVEQMVPAALRVLLKMICTNLQTNDAELADIVDPRTFLHLWHSHMHLDCPNELNKSIGKHIIHLLQRVGPAPVEFFDHFLFHLPDQLRYKFLFLQQLLANIPPGQLSEHQMVRCFSQLAACLEGRGYEAASSDAFQALAIKFVESGRSEMLVRLISNTLLTSSNISILQNALRFWFPKLFFSPILRPLFRDLLHLFRSSSASSPLPNHHHSSSSSSAPFPSSFWALDDQLCPSLRWSPPEIGLWLFLHTLRWTIRAEGNLAICAQDARLIRTAMGAQCGKEEIREAAMDCLGMIIGKGQKQFDILVSHDLLDPRQLFAQFLAADHAPFRRSLLSLLAGLFDLPQYKVQIMESIGGWLSKVPAECGAEYSPVTGNLLHFLERVRLSTDEEQDLRVHAFLLKCLVFPHDSTVRQKAAKMAAPFAHHSAQFRRKFIRAFNRHAPALAYGIGPLYESILRAEMTEQEQDELEMAFVEEKGEGMAILLGKLRIEQGKPWEIGHNNGNGTEEGGQTRRMLAHCMEVNERLLRAGGSGELAKCLTVSELNSNFEGHDSDDDDDDGLLDDDDALCWSESQRAHLSRYSNGIIQSCSAIRWLITSNKLGLDDQSICAGLRSLWSVLLRSHHKGILEHCGSDFAAVIGHLCAHFPPELFSTFINDLFEKTFSLLLHGGGQCRNISFVKIFLPILSHLGSEQQTFLIRSFMAIRQWQRSAINGANSNLLPTAPPTTRLHVLFLFRALLLCADFDFSILHADLLQFILDAIPQESTSESEGQAQRWRHLSMAANAFAALLHSVFRHFPSSIPFNNFFSTHPQFCTILLHTLRQIRSQMAPNCAFKSTRPSLALLLVPLQRLFVAQFPFANCPKADSFARELCSELNCLMSLEPSLLIRKQICEVLDNFSLPKSAKE